MNDYQIKASNLLELIIKEQKALISLPNASESNGKGLADFCATFILKYSEHLRQMDQIPSPPAQP